MTNLPAGITTISGRSAQSRKVAPDRNCRTKSTHPIATTASAAKRAKEDANADRRSFRIGPPDVGEQSCFRALTT